MNEEYYIVICGWMRKLGLTGNDLLVYAFINGYSQNGQGAFYGSLPTLCEACGIARRTAIDVLARLTDQGFLKKAETWHNGVRYCSYQVRLEGGAESAQVVQNLHRGGAKSAPNNKDNNKDKSLSIESEARARKSGSSVKFVAPSVEDVRAYAAEHHLALDADHFVAHYTANGWKVGKAPMKDWRAAVVAWVKREAEFQRPAARAAAAEDATLHPNAVWERLAREGKI